MLIQVHDLAHFCAKYNTYRIILIMLPRMPQAIITSQLAAQYGPITIATHRVPEATDLELESERSRV